jgi:hypothetical protein
LEKKQGKEKPSVTRRVDSAKQGQKLGCNPLIFFFLLKRHRFDFLNKKLTRASH